MRTCGWSDHPSSGTPEADVEPFVRLLGEMISATLARNGQELAEVTLNVSNVTVAPGAAGPVPDGDFVAITIHSAGDWTPETSWRPDAEPARSS
jgi:hypothetical protein